MGKASKWFRGLLGLKRPDSPSSTTAAASAPKPPKEKRRWGFVKSYRENKDNHHHHATANPSAHVAVAAHPDNEAMAVATATAAIAEAAVAAAAQATAAVTRLVSSNGGRSAIAREKWAAVKIQAAFRGCLARRALRALKGLVKLQALVRGHIERKRTAEWLQRMQTLLRAQARARAGRAQILQRAKSSTANLHGPATPEKFESPIRSASVKYDQSSSILKRTGSKSCLHIGNTAKCENGSDIMANERSWNQQRSWTRTCSMDDERSAKILEIDSGKPHIASKRRNLFYSSSQPLVSDYYNQSLTATKDSTSYQSVQSSSSFEVQSYSPLKINEVDESSICGADNNSDGSKRSPFTPAKSDGSRSYLSNYSDYPSYMAYTESSKAKVRSLSAPRLRPQYERSCSYNRHSLHGIYGSRSATQRVPALRASFTSKAYPGSGHLDNLGLPVGYRY